MRLICKTNSQLLVVLITAIFLSTSIGCRTKSPSIPKLTDLAWWKKDDIRLSAPPPSTHFDPEPAIQMQASNIKDSAEAVAENATSKFGSEMDGVKEFASKPIRKPYSFGDGEKNQLSKTFDRTTEDLKTHLPDWDAPKVASTTKSGVKDVQASLNNSFEATKKSAVKASQDFDAGWKTNFALPGNSNSNGMTKTVDAARDSLNRVQQDVSANTDSFADRIQQVVSSGESTVGTATKKLNQFGDGNSFQAKAKSQLQHQFQQATGQIQQNSNQFQQQASSQLQQVTGQFQQAANQIQQPANQQIQQNANQFQQQASNQIQQATGRFQQAANQIQQPANQQLQQSVNQFQQATGQVQQVSGQFQQGANQNQLQPNAGQFQSGMNQVAQGVGNQFQQASNGFQQNVNGMQQPFGNQVQQATNQVQQQAGSQMQQLQQAAGNTMNNVQNYAGQFQSQSTNPTASLARLNVQRLNQSTKEGFQAQQFGQPSATNPLVQQPFQPAAGIQQPTNSGNGMPSNSLRPLGTQQQPAQTFQPQMQQQTPMQTIPASTDESYPSTPHQNYAPRGGQSASPIPSTPVVPVGFNAGSTSGSKVVTAGGQQDIVKGDKSLSPNAVDVPESIIRGTGSFAPGSVSRLLPNEK